MVDKGELAVLLGLAQHMLLVIERPILDSEPDRSTARFAGVPLSNQNAGSVNASAESTPVSTGAGGPVFTRRHFRSTGWRRSATGSPGRRLTPGDERVASAQRAVASAASKLQFTWSAIGVAWSTRT
jgi:hypothetical protein